MKNYVIGIDQGTTGSFVGLMNAGGNIVSSAYRAHQQFYPQPGWVEQDPNELWHTACELLNQVMIEAKIEAHEIAGIGIANQGESVLMWDRQTGEALYPVLVWQDTRTQAETEHLAANPDAAAEVARRTGLKLDSYFSASKIRWLLDHVPEAPELLRANRLACGTLDSWLIWKLTEGHVFVTDASTASRTLLFNIDRLEWDEWLLNLFNIPPEVLPVVLESTAEFCRVSHPALLCRDVPIVASLVDQPAAMIGQGCLRAAQIKATYGTGCFVNLNTGVKAVSSQHGLLTMLAWHRDGQATYGLDGGIFTAAATLNWLSDKALLISDSKMIDALCANVDNSGGVLWVPAQIGLGAPYWNRDVRGAWLGIDLSTSQAHLIRAVLEGIAAHVTRVIHAMISDTQLMISALRVDGGLTNSATMMQIQADLLGYPVEVIDNREATTSGVCALAARATGLWQSDDLIYQQVRVAKTYEPAVSEDKRLVMLDRFDRAVDALKEWHRHA
jgi:glycerol kinase